MEIEIPFPQFLQESAILSQRQADSLTNSMAKKDEDQKIFILSDFFRSLSASDCYDLSLRLYMYWKRNSSISEIQPSLTRIPDTTPRNKRTMKSPKNNTSMTTSHSNIKNRVLSPDTSDCDIKGVRRSNTHNNSGIFDSLHKVAQMRESMRSENEKKKLEKEVEECIHTFQPKTNRSTLSLSRTSTDVFDRLQRDIRKDKQEFNEAKKAQKEMKGCTFHPEVLNPHDNSQPAPNAVLSRTFDRLYRESQRRKNNSIDYELKRKELEVKGCTFQPATTNRNDASVDDGVPRSEKLHKLHEERERKLLKKQIEKTMEESNKYSFQPKTHSSPTRRDDSKEVYERLLEWREQKNRKMEIKYKEMVAKEKEMSQERQFRRKDDNDVSKDQSSIHERLYKESTQQKAKKEKMVQEVLKDMGASFKPKTNTSRGSSAKAPKRMGLSLQFMNIKEAIQDKDKEYKFDTSIEDEKMPSQRDMLLVPEQLSSGRRNPFEDSKNQPLSVPEIRTATFGN